MSNEQINNTATIGSSESHVAPDVLMLMGTHCAYCLPMMQVLSELMKAGHIGELRIVNIEDNTQLASQYDVRNVPWLRVGQFELSGSRSKQELLQWLKRASTFEGITAYLDEVLSEGSIQSANKLVDEDPHVLVNVIELMADPDAKINVRLGVGVIIEDLAESEEFKIAIPPLINHLSSDDARVRGDACHYLSLTKDVSHIAAIENLLNDESEEVREIAQDSLDELRVIE